MSAAGTDPEETGDLAQAVTDAWTDAFTDPNADSLDALVAAVEARTREQVAREIEATPSTTTQRIEYALTSPEYALHGPYLIAARDLQEAALVAADDPGSQIVQRTVTTTTTPWTKAGEAR